MEYKPLLNVKEEIEYEDYDIKNIFDDNFNLKLECEDVDIEENDWCIQNVINDEDTFRHSVIDSEELTQYCSQQCLQCHMIFPNCYQLLTHNVAHININIEKAIYFQCADCDKIFLLRFKLQQHIKAYHENSIRKIKHKNIGSVSKGKRYCEICEKLLSYKNWHAHKTEVHAKRKFECHICGYKFKGPRYLKRHIANIHEKHLNAPKKIVLKPCPICDNTFNNGDLLNKHIKNCHSNEAYDCSLCTYVNRFNSLPYLRTHLQRRHKTKVFRFSCDICNKSFKWLQLLNIHTEKCH